MRHRIVLIVRLQLMLKQRAVKARVLVNRARMVKRPPLGVITLASAQICARQGKQDQQLEVALNVKLENSRQHRDRRHALFALLTLTVCREVHIAHATLDIQCQVLMCVQAVRQEATSLQWDLGLVRNVLSENTQRGLQQPRCRHAEIVPRARFWPAQATLPWVIVLHVL